MLVGDDEFCVSEPGDGVFGRAFHGTGEEQRAANASFQILRRQGYSQRICEEGKQKFGDLKTVTKKD